MSRTAHFATVVAGLALLGACAQTGVGPPAASGPCNAAAAQFAVNQTGNSQLAERAMRAAGARQVRWLRPGEAYTLEFNPERLNLQVDAANNVIAVSCG